MPTHPGLTADEMLESALRGEIDVLYSSGGNFLEVLPDADVGHGRAASGCRCVSTRTSSCRRQMLVDGETVVLLPAATRYEQRDGGTETTTERRDRVQPRDRGAPRRRGAQ